MGWGGGSTKEDFSFFIGLIWCKSDPEEEKKTREKKRWKKKKGGGGGGALYKRNLQKEN